MADQVTAACLAGLASLAFRLENFGSRKHASKAIRPHRNDTLHWHLLPVDVTAHGRHALPCFTMLCVLLVLMLDRMHSAILRQGTALRGCHFDSAVNGEGNLLEGTGNNVSACGLAAASGL